MPLEPDPAPRIAPASLWLLTFGILSVIAICIGAVGIYYFFPTSFALLLTSLIALLGAGIAAVALYAYYCQLRDSLSLPLQEVIESVDRLANGDSGSPIWGIYRNDAVGELARNIEHLRQYFSETGDVQIESERGPLRVKFDGEAAPLFDRLQQSMQAAMQTVAEAAMNLQETTNASRTEAHAFTGELRQNLLQLTETAATCNSQISGMHDDLRHSTSRLLSAQNESVQQLNAVVPALGEKLNALDQVAKIAGQQTEITLKQLLQSSHSMRETAQFSNTVSQKFAKESEELSARMFAAINLLRSSGKAMADTNDLTRGRVNEMVTALTQAEQELRRTLDSAASRITVTADMADRISDLTIRTEASASMMTSAVDGLLQHNAGFAQQIEANSKRFNAMLTNVDTLQQNFSGAISTISVRGEQIEQVLRHLRQQHERLMTELTRSSGDAAAGLSKLATESEQLIARVEAQLALAGAIADGELRRLGEATTVAAESAQIASNQLTQATQMLIEGGAKVDQVSGNMQTQLARLDREIGGAIENMVARTDEIATRTEAKVTAVYDRVDDMAQRLTALSQLTGTMGQVAAQLGGIIPQLGQGGTSGGLSELRQEIRTIANGIGLWQQEVATTLAALPARMGTMLGTNPDSSLADSSLSVIRAQIESTRQDVLTSITGTSGDVLHRLHGLEEVGSFVADHITTPKPDNVGGALRGVLAALGQITTQLHQIDQRLPRGNGVITPFMIANDTQDKKHVDQALTTVTDIFTSLRDRGDDVINRLNQVANHLQSAAEKIQRH